MTKQKRKIDFFSKYLTVWVLLCMAAGILIGQFLPAVSSVLGRFEYANVSVPIAILIWLMIFPMMMKVDFKSIKNVGRNPKGLFVTWITNWLIKPYTMYGIASLFFLVAVAVAIALFGTGSPVALATIVGVLVEVPVMLILVGIANRTKGWFRA